MALLDIFALTLMVLSCVIGIWRGAVKEFLYLFAWLIAIWFAAEWGLWLVNKWLYLVPTAGLRFLLAYGIILIAVRMGLQILINLLHKLLHTFKLQSLNRTLGGLFGFLRGLIMAWIITTLFIHLGFTSFPWWLRSTSGGFFLWLHHSLKTIFPDMAV